MAEVTVKQLAEVVGIPTDTLLEQMREAGLEHGSADDVVSDEQKQQLLGHLKKSHGEEESEPKRITLKRKTSTTLKGSGSAGRSKSVAVEVRKKRTYVKRSAMEESEERAAEERAEEEARLQAEQEAAEQAAAEAKAKEAEEKQQAAAKAEEDARIQAEEEALRKEKRKETEQLSAQELDEKKEAEEKAKALRKAAVKAKAAEVLAETPQEKAKRLAEEAKAKAAEDARRKKEDEALRKAEEEAARKTKEEAARLAEELATRSDDDAKGEQEEEDTSSIVAQAFEESLQREDREIKKGSGKRDKKRGGFDDFQKERSAQLKLKSRLSGQHGFERPTKQEIHEVNIGESIAVSDLAAQLKMKANEVVKQLIKMGEMVSVNQRIDQETATLFVEEIGHNVKVVSENVLEDRLAESLTEEHAGELEGRAPVVTIMGHVDHGKTSLLDYIRRAKVADGEAGGITQHIGAYHVQTDNGQISFLDTPGHAAFTAMRARGAKATDIVVVVVAADDGVMPQTEEAINHAKAAEVPIIIAVNKIDKEEADLERVKSEMAAKEVIPEDWGGEYQFIPVSAHSGQGVEDLLEAISLQSELLELKAPRTGAAKGVVIESRLDKGKGAVTSLLIQQGELKTSDMVLAGENFGRVRAMVDEDGKPIKAAGPSIPVEILGLNGAPEAGEEFLVVPDERKAREVAEHRSERQREAKLSRAQSSKLENLFASMGQGEKKAVNIVLKTDVRGSLEALIGALTDLATDEVEVKVVYAGVGGITESDVNLAITSNAFMLGFNVRADGSAKRQCEAEGIDLRYYSIIYELIDDVKAAMSGLLEPERREEIVGIAEVRDVFRSSKFGAAAGCMVVEGSVFKSKPIRVLRDDVVVFEGELESLRRFKDDVNEVKSGTECGIAVKNYNDIKAGDKIEVFDVKIIERRL